jgi:hypothetical protein
VTAVDGRPVRLEPKLFLKLPFRRLQIRELAQLVAILLLCEHLERCWSSLPLRGMISASFIRQLQRRGPGIQAMTKACKQRNERLEHPGL